MASDIPYMTSSKNLAAILQKIKSAGTPPKFTHEFLRSNLGFTSSGDRSVVRVLKGLGFLSPDAVPTPRYNEFREASKSGRALAVGLREGWSDVFLSDQRAFERSSSELKELFKNVTGKGESAAEKMAATFKILADQATWAGDEEVPPEEIAPADHPPEQLEPRGALMTLRHDIHVHLPATSDVAVYTAIFRALRSELGV
jgi:Family of unknown function (DUF5343)